MGATALPCSCGASRNLPHLAKRMDSSEIDIVRTSVLSLTRVGSFTHCGLLKRSQIFEQLLALLTKVPGKGAVP